MDELDSTKRVRSINDNDCVDSWYGLDVGSPYKSQKYDNQKK
jgi:hypothetical protein